MPMTLVEHNPNLACPNCGKKMVEVSGWKYYNCKLNNHSKITQ